MAAIVKRDKKFTSKTQIAAVAITATEMYFRPLPYRLVEYIYVILLLLLGKDAASVSVGISQISIRHYVSLEDVSQFQALRLSTSARENLGICCKIIEEKKWQCLEEVCEFYNGNSNLHYRMKLKQNYDLLHELELIREMHSSSS